MFRYLIVAGLLTIYSIFAVAGGQCPATGCGGCPSSKKANSESKVQFNDGKVKKAEDVQTLPAGNVYRTLDGSERFVCPVMGNHGNVKDATSYSDVQGKRFYHCCAGCAEPFQKDPAKYLEKLSLPAFIVKVDGKTMWAKCPVSGEQFKVKKDSPFYVYEGHTYYFCCDDCKPAFVKNPSKFAIQKETKS
ncbi:MAG: YHS domain-containing protein [bacterium]|nr:YHS domain-containing protein [bacterium]